MRINLEKAKNIGKIPNLTGLKSHSIEDDCIQNINVTKEDGANNKSSGDDCTNGVRGGELT